MVENLKAFLEMKANQYNRKEFIEMDPISIPHAFNLKQDIEIMGFFAAILAWGQRKTIINKCKELADRMDGEPHNFITNHQDSDLRKLLGFKHRTFNDTDLLYFVYFLRNHYIRFESLESAFIPSKNSENFVDVESHINFFRSYFCSLPDFPLRTIKHVSSPMQNSACKRINMFLRWMVRKDESGVDFGIWDQIKPRQLICPCDVHVERVARKLKLISRRQLDWLTALELTSRLRDFDSNDPAKYDFALFGLGIEERL